MANNDSESIVYMLRWILLQNDLQFVTHTHTHTHITALTHIVDYDLSCPHQVKCVSEGNLGREGGRKGGREGGREEGREGGREGGGREGGREGGSEGTTGCEAWPTL